MIKSRTKFNIQKYRVKMLTSALVFACTFLFYAPVSAQDSSQKAFNLVTVVDNILNFDGDTKNQYEARDEKTRQRIEYIETTRRFNQGNVSVAYNDYSKIISEADNDIAHFIFAKSMYEIGFFTLGDVSISKIKNQNYFTNQINDLKASYKTSYPLDKQEEIFLAKAYVSIYFDNTPEETAFDLNKKTGLLGKSDYANFIMAQALLESRQYQQALMFINAAIEKNPENPAYIVYKAEIMDKSGKHKEALKFLEKFENSNIITPQFQTKFASQKEHILASLSGNENDKRLHFINIDYLEGNYYKVINECQNILNFNKNNYKILTLQAKSQLNTGKIDLAKKGFSQSLELNKNYAPALSGMGDILYIEGNVPDAVEYYKKALKANKEDIETKVKLQIAYKNIKGSEKPLAKIEKEIELTKRYTTAGQINLFYENYLAAIGMLRNDKKQKRKYLLKSLGANLLFPGAQSEYLAYLSDENRQKPLQNFIYMVSFVNNYDYTYYYFRGVSEIALGNKDEAEINIKHCISLNPDYEPAQKALVNLKDTYEDKQEENLI